MFRSRYAMLLMALVGFAASAAFYYGSREFDWSLLNAQLNQRTSTQQARIQAKLDGFSVSLSHLRDFFSADRPLGPDKFHEVARAEMARRPGLSEIQWVPFVPGTDRSYYEQHGQRVVSGNFHFIERTDKGLLTPAADRPEYYPVFYVEPQAGHELNLGEDLRSGSLAAELMRARQSGKTILAWTSIASTTKELSKKGVFICPVFSRLGDAVAPSQRGEFMGFVLGVFTLDQILSESWKEIHEPLADVMVLDGTTLDRSKRFLQYFTPEVDEDKSTPPTEEEFRSGWQREYSLPIGETLSLFVYRYKAPWIETQRSILPLVILVGSGAVALFLIVYVRFALRRGDLNERNLGQRIAELAALRAQQEQDNRLRAEAENELRHSQQQLQGLMENSPNAIFVKDIDGRYLSVNKRFAELHTRAREQFIGRSDLDLFPPEVAARTRMSDTRVISTGKPVELEDSFALLDGNHTSIVHKFPLIGTDGSVQGLCGIATDISERKQAEAEIRESRRQLESLLGQLPGMAFRCVNEEGQYSPVYVSRGALGLTGHSARDFLEKHVSLQEIVHPEDREVARSAIASAVKKRRAFEVEYRLIDRAGRIKWVLERGQGVYNEDGKLLFIEGLAIDVTQRKDAEAEKLIVERRLLEGQKLESIGVLAGGIAHDFNNLLTGIIGNANLASLELPVASPLQQNLKQIENASQRAAELCQQMLAYAGKGRFIVQKIELGTLVENTVPLLRVSISKRATLRFQLQPALPMVMADATQMRQIVMNLVLNASEALGDRDGEIGITTNLVRPSGDFFDGAVLSPPETSIDFVQLEVRDSGSGMSPETMAKIFDPFFTTKFAGRGLGLAAVLGIIRSHRGGLKVRSEVGKGSLFTLLFPAAAPGQVETPIVRRAAIVPWKCEGRALVIDDEDHVLKVTAGMLNSCGLKTDLARDGYEGLDLFRAKPSRFDIVLLDMTMPRLSGEETLLLLREVLPNVRVLFMSGYNRREVVDTLAGSGQLAFIQKPFTLEALRENLQAILTT